MSNHFRSACTVLLLSALGAAASAPTELVITTPGGKPTIVRIDNAPPPKPPSAPASGVNSMPPTTAFELNAASIMKPAKGLNTVRVQPTAIVATPSDPIGAFRVGCAASHMLFDDPLVYPGHPGRSHLHQFFGNTGANAYSTAASLANSGNSTCVGGIANRSAYWIPAMINRILGFAVPADNSVNYYKGDYNYYLRARSALIQPHPAGLRMIAGDPTNRQTASTGVFRWDCVAPGYSSAGTSIPGKACPNGGQVILLVTFPSCWDGVNLDAPDHQSHMRYPQSTGCPATHPVPLPTLSMNVHWNVNAKNRPEDWVLASDNYPPGTLPAGLSAHADFFEAWVPEIKATFVKKCINELRDGRAHLLCDGNTLY